MKIQGCFSTMDNGGENNIWRRELGLHPALDIRGGEIPLVVKRDWNCEHGNSTTVCRGPLRPSNQLWWVSHGLLCVTG